LLLLKLADHSVHALSLEKLPGIYDDSLKAVREENAKHTLRRANHQRPRAPATARARLRIPPRRAAIEGARRVGDQ